MKKISASKFSGETKEEEVIVLAGDHHLPLLTNYNNQQVIWYGGRVILPSILEENCLTHEVGAPSQSSAFPAPAVVYKPTPLRFFRPPTVDFNGIHIPTGEVDTTFGLSHYVPRKSDEIKKRESNNLMPDLGRLRHDSFAGVVVDDVDTLLSLRLPGTPDPKKSRKQAKGKGKALDHNPTGDMSNLGWLRPGFFDGVEDDGVDTTLSLRLPGTTDPRKSRMQEKGKGKALDHNPFGDMSNLGWLRPGFFDGVEDDKVDTTLSLRPLGTADPRKSRMQEKGKKRKADAGDTERKKSSKRRNIVEDDNSRPLIPIEEIPTLMKAVESRNGSRPRFLYRKILEDSDRNRHHNRLFVTRRDENHEMMNYLRAEEKAAVDNQVGQKIVGVDGGGNVYDNLVLKKWYSLKMTVINSDWRKVVEANEAEAGDVVEIWGFRGVDEKPCFAFNFRKQNAAGASNSGTSGNDEGTSMA